MRVLFAESAHFTGPIAPRDSLHALCRAALLNAEPTRIVTTDLVLAGPLNHFAAATPALRRTAAGSAGTLLRDPMTELVTGTEPRILDAVALGGARRDKMCSLTGCPPSVVMPRRAIRDALTHDRHLAWAGVRARLR